MLIKNYKTLQLEGALLRDLGNNTTSSKDSMCIEITHNKGIK